jgi:putative aldouronate transport system substrate-binding protein
MKIKKRFLAPLVSLMMVVSLAAGCSSSGNNSNTPTSSNKVTDTAVADAYQLGKAPLEISFYGNYDWYTMPSWGEDISTKWIKDNKKVDIKPIQSGGAAATKLNTMIATNELPDVIWLDRGPDVEKLRAAGMLVAFDPYLDKYPNLKEWLGEDGINMLRSQDGKIYQFPNWYTSQPNGNAGYVVNKKIYTDLGSPKLETTDDFYSYLKLVKEKYPDIIPFEPHLAKDGQGLDVLYSAFKENVQSTYIGMRGVPNGNELTSIFTDPTFRESTQYASKLFREKLMTQDALTQTLDQVTEKILGGKVAVFASASPTELAMKGHADLAKKDANGGYFMIWPIHKEGLDKTKIFTGTYSQLGWNVSVITKGAKDPEAVFAFLDWYTGPEAQSVQMWGPPGTYWDGTEADGKTPKFTDKYVSDGEGLAKLQALTTNFMWNGNTVFIDKAKAKFETTLPVEQRNWATQWQYEITWKTQADATQFINLDPMPESEEGIIRQRVDDIFQEARAKTLYAKNDAEVIAILDQAEKDAQKSGYAKLLKFRTDKWQENLKKMKK